MQGVAAKLPRVHGVDRSRTVFSLTKLLNLGLSE